MRVRSAQARIWRAVVLGLATAAAVAGIAAYCAPTAYQFQCSRPPEGHETGCVIRLSAALNSVCLFQTEGIPVEGVGWPEVTDIRDVPLPSGWNWREFDFDLGVHEIVKAGWPLPCLRSERRDTALANPGDLGEGERRWALPVRDPKYAWGRGTLNGTIPLRPIWSGLALNTAAFGATWWVLLTATCWCWSTRVSARRARRGVCTACGYDLRADFAHGCPECGWNRSPSEAPRSS